MTSFLTKTKSYESYEQRISTEPASTQRSKNYAISNFEKFVSETYDGRTVDEIIAELFLVKADNEQGLEDSLYDMLQEWIVLSRHTLTCFWIIFVPRFLTFFCSHYSDYAFIEYEFDLTKPESILVELDMLSFSHYFHNAWNVVF